MQVTSPDLSAVEPRRRRCALFVDFDNVYIGLQQLSQKVADKFADDPAHWLGELTTGSDDDGDFTRRFLLLKCYLNPSRFSEFRPKFTRAGFQVVDCPSLTQQGKSSADINLVLDAVDALAATTRYEEFVILSADADFTPLIQRCRAEDRRVAIVTASQAAGAYRAVADTVIDADSFVSLVTETEALAGDEPQPARPAKAPASPAVTPPPATPTTKDLTSQKGRRAVLRLLQAADRPVPLSTAGQAAQQADPTLPSSNWRGAGSFSKWLERELPNLRLKKDPGSGFVWDPKRFDEADLPGAVTTTDLSKLLRRVVEVTDVPGLTQAHYGTLLTKLADDLAKNPFDATDTAHRVYEACQKSGAKVGQATVRLVIAGILYAGTKLADAKPTKQQLAKAWAGNVVGLCRGARMELTKAEEKAIRTWVGGGLAS